MDRVLSRFEEGFRNSNKIKNKDCLNHQVHQVHQERQIIKLIFSKTFQEFFVVLGELGGKKGFALSS
jgi:hypothetical protein